MKCDYFDNHFPNEPSTSGLGLMTIAEAAAFLHSSIPVSALHRARREGRLWATQVGKLFYTNEAALLEFLQCHGTDNRRGFISDPMNGNGSSVTERSKSGRDTVLNSVKRLRESLHNTSPINSQSGAAVLSIRRS